MEILNSFESLHSRLVECQGESGNTVGTALTIGVFDGIHLGHQELIRRTINIAKEKNLKSVVVSFDEHPLTVLAPPHSPKRLLPKKHKSDLIRQTGVDFYLEIPFTIHFSKIPAEEFVVDMLVRKARVKEVLCGYDFSFGAMGQGNIALLKSLGERFGFHLSVLGAVDQEGVLIKSTHIRDVVSRGNVVEAAQYLGRPHIIEGTVVEGMKRGRQLGFPTANLNVSPLNMIPDIGVYFCMVEIDGEENDRPAMVNIGISPTFSENRYSIEAHLIDYSGDLYGKKLGLKFIKRIRDEKKFASVGELVEQLEKDRTVSRELVEKITLN